MKDDPDFNIYFVTRIQENPCLYDYTSADYRNIHLQEKTWEKIATQVSESAHDCKERWKNLRGCYTRHLKHTASALNQTKIKKPYYLAEYLNFLKPYTKTRKSRSLFNTLSTAMTITSFPQLIEGENKNESDSDIEETTQEYDIRHESPSQLSYDDHCFVPPPPKQLKENANINLSTFNHQRTIDNKLENMYQDPDLSFLISILPDIKEMNSIQKRKFKIGILNLAGQILNESRIQATNESLSSTIHGYNITKSETY